MLYLYGASGHAKVVLEIAEHHGFVIGGLVDANPDIKELLGYKVTTGLPDREYDGNTFVVSIGDNIARKRVADRLVAELADCFFEILAHPDASVSTRAEIGSGTVVMAGAAINADSIIGNHCIINTGATIDHDCVIGDYAHVSPGVFLAGDVHVGEGTHVGIGACVIQGVRIGRWCTIGAGAVIIRDVPDGATVVGNPGRIIKNDGVRI